VLEDGSLAHWDLAPYEVAIPADAVSPITVTADLWYQTTIREFVEFLRDTNVTDDSGQRMYDLWVKYDRDPPEHMEHATTQFAVQPPLFDFGDDDDDEEDPTACACGSGGAGAVGWWVVAGLVAARRRQNSGS
jgi:MYXO-CTERM domain-containing protein